MYWQPIFLIILLCKNHTFTNYMQRREALNMSGMSNFEIKTVMVLKEDLINDINSNFFVVLWQEIAFSL